MWAGPRHYPQKLPIDVLDRHRRLALTCTVLREHSDAVDVVALQEVTLCDIDTLHDALGRKEFSVGYARYPEHYWSHWLDDSTPWEPNGTVLFLRKATFASAQYASVPIGPYGNQAVIATAMTRGGAKVTSVSVHLDADDADRQFEEWTGLLGEIGADEATRVLVCGDLNCDTATLSMKESLTAHHLIDALAATGNHDPTHPYARPGDGHSLWARIDHIVSRGLIPMRGEVLDAGVWGLEVPEARIEALLRATGSDHHAVSCTFAGVDTMP